MIDHTLSGCLKIKDPHSHICNLHQSLVESLSLQNLGNHCVYHHSIPVLNYFFEQENILMDTAQVVGLVIKMFQYFKPGQIIIGSHTALPCSCVTVVLDQWFWHTLDFSGICHYHFPYQGWTLSDFENLMHMKCPNKPFHTRQYLQKLNIPTVVHIMSHASYVNSYKKKANRIVTLYETAKKLKLLQNCINLFNQSPHICLFTMIA